LCDVEHPITGEFQTTMEYHNANKDKTGIIILDLPYKGSVKKTMFSMSLYKNGERDNIFKTVNIKNNQIF
jgi:hypothetical protein